MAKKADMDEAPGTIGARLKELSERDGVHVFSLFRRMRDGDKRVASKLVDYLRGDPALAGAVLEFASTATSHWLDFGASEPFSRFVMEERVKRLRRSLLGDSPTPPERLLVERILICSLQVQIAEAQYIGVMKGGTTFAKAKFYEDLQDRAQRRYLAAIKALAQVRRLQLPAVAQLNVATNQVNVAQPESIANEQVSAASAPALPDQGAVTVDDVLTGWDVECVVHERAGKAETG